MTHNSNNLESRILAALDAGDQIPATELAKRLAITDDYALRNAVRDLAKLGKITRHHNPDGILRYSAGGVAASRKQQANAGKSKTEQANSTAKVRDAILSTLQAAGGEMRTGALRDAVATVGSANQVQFQLQRLAAAGRIARAGHTLTATVRLIEGNGEAAAAPPPPPPPAPPKPEARSPKPEARSPKPEARSPKPEASRRRDFLAAAESAEKTLKALQFCERVAQDALDIYLHSLGDKAVLGPLVAARDGSRAAVEAFVAGGMTGRR